MDILPQTCGVVYRGGLGIIEKARKTRVVGTNLVPVVAQPQGLNVRRFAKALRWNDA
ncbi:MAG: hypothetical protein ABSH52_27675 [Terriglobia bacterium]|jgi:hypothetical protein